MPYVFHYNADSLNLWHMVIFVRVQNMGLHCILAQL